MKPAYFFDSGVNGHCQYPWVRCKLDRNFFPDIIFIISFIGLGNSNWDSITLFRCLASKQTRTEPSFFTVVIIGEMYLGDARSMTPHSTIWSMVRSTAGRCATGIGYSSACRRRETASDRLEHPSKEQEMFGGK
ncbi:uncharacterized protein LOC123316840 isoform X1 [Coccinella septempunctata]|uniref:uncharacterized protein LOC123316840 isoform X1 n=1 Tax=Coccinella septempunctata TaxID=41139 RepID=UPI001D06B572|nr:uncharacterized protein LOC123316840 isoform X1 [Coccinella septempunctata]